MAELASWRDGAARRAITAFVERATTGPGAVPEEARVAVFDNDGTLWSEKPMPAQQWRLAAGAEDWVDVFPARKNVA